MLRRMRVGIAVMIVPLAGSACASDAKYDAEPVPVRRMTPDHLLGVAKGHDVPAQLLKHR